MHINKGRRENARIPYVRFSNASVPTDIIGDVSQSTSMKMKVWSLKRSVGDNLNLNFYSFHCSDTMTSYLASSHSHAHIFVPTSSQLAQLQFCITVMKKTHTLLLTESSKLFLLSIMVCLPWTNLSCGRMAFKAVLIAALATRSFMVMAKGDELSNNDSNMPSLAERFVTIAGEKQDNASQLRRLEEDNKRKNRKRTIESGGQNMVTMSATNSDCTSQFCQNQLSDVCLLEYKVNKVVPETITMVLVCKGSSWAGVGFSESGRMIGSDAVIGIPGKTATKYHLGGYGLSAIAPMENKRQKTLTDASISYDEADDVTVLKFTKILQEDGEVNIKPGKNTFLYAKGSSSNLSYHQERGLFELDIPDVSAVTSEKTKKRKDRNKEKKDDLAEVPQAQESKRKQGKGDGKQTLAEKFASRGPIQLRPLKDLRLQLSPPVPTTSSNDFPYPYPKIRFIPWEKLSPFTKEIMEENFGYSKRNWNALGQNENEHKTCSELKDTQHEAIQLLGWDCNVWDCFINHYKSYTGKQLEGNKLLEHVDVVRSAWVKLWMDLSEQELQSATRLCFTQKVWDVGYLGPN